MLHKISSNSNIHLFTLTTAIIESQYNTIALEWYGAFLSSLAAITSVCLTLNPTLVSNLRYDDLK